MKHWIFRDLLEPYSRHATAAATMAIVGLTLLISGPASAQADNSAVPAKQTVASTEQVETIVVTARRTRESLQRVPVSVTAITGEDLAERSLDSLMAVGQAMPNFTFSQNAHDGRSAGIIYMRGVGQADPMATYDPAVGVYIDGVYLGRMQGNDLEMMEIERLEVLRGPQGTLFGKNTSGGAINITTKQPDSSDSGLSGKFQVTGGSRNRRDLLGGLNVPLASNTAALQMSVSQRKQDGYGKRADGQEMANTNRDSARVSLFLKPTRSFNAVLSADYSSSNEANVDGKLLAVNTSIMPIAVLNAVSPVKYDNRWLPTSDFTSNATGGNASKGRVTGSSLTLNYDAGWANLKSITAYRTLESIQEQDPDGSPVQIIDLVQKTRQHQVSQEIQAAGKSFGNRLDWVLGAYYFDEKANDDSHYLVFTPLGLGNSFRRTLDVSNKSVAAYGQGSYNVTERLRLTAGLRNTHDNKEVQRTRLTYPVEGLLEPLATRSVASRDTSPRLGFDYQWTPSVMTYVSAAKGYKAGGFNGKAPTVADFNEYMPEKVSTYEIGLRSDLWDRRVRFNATVFYSDYKDLQLQINGSTVGAGGAVSPFNVVTNVPKARITGGEVELAVVPAKGLKITSSLGITNASYVELPTDAKFIAANLINLNSQFPYTPKAAFTFGAVYTTRMTDDIDVTGRIDYAYKRTIYYDAPNSALLRQDPYGLVNARLTFDLDRSRISLSLYAINLTNKHFIVGGYNDAAVPNPGLGFAYALMGPPREFGLSAQIRF